MMENFDFTPEQTKNLIELIKETWRCSDCWCHTYTIEDKEIKDILNELEGN